MLSNPQKALLKRAQREAGLHDDDYREAIQSVTGFRTSTDPSITDRHLDMLLAYFEAIHWRGVDAGTLRPSRNIKAVFKKRGYWKHKNTRQETSRDRYNNFNLGQQIAELEGQLDGLGYGHAYCGQIRAKVTHGRSDAHALHLYCSALKRTLAAKAKTTEAADDPF